jgi:hypothetical protein
VSLATPALAEDPAPPPDPERVRSPWTAGFYMHEPMESTWSRVYDGVFFIDVQKPATPLALSRLGTEELDREGYVGEAGAATPVATRLSRAIASSNGPSQSRLLTRTASSRSRKAIRANPRCRMGSSCSDVSFTAR